MIKNCYQIAVEDPSYEYECMRDKYEIKKIIENGYFASFKQRNIKRNLIVSENYTKFTLTKKEIEIIEKQLKLTKSRIYKCFLLVKFALLDESDRLAMDLYKKELQKNKNVLLKDFDDNNKMKHRCVIKYDIEPPYMILTLKVYHMII